MPDIIPLYTFDDDVSKYDDPVYIEQLEQQAIQDKEQEAYEKGCEGG